MSDELTITRGSDLSALFTLTNEDGSAFDLTGYSVSVFDSSAWLSGLISLSVVSPATAGKITMTLPYSADLRDGRQNWFRAGIQDASGFDTQFSVLWVVVK